MAFASFPFLIPFLNYYVLYNLNDVTSVTWSSSENHPYNWINFTKLAKLFWVISDQKKFHREVQDILWIRQRNNQAGYSTCHNGKFPCKIMQSLEYLDSRLIERPTCIPLRKESNPAIIWL